MLTELTFFHKSWQTFRSIINIIIDLFNSEDRYAPWNTTAPLCLQPRPHLGSRMRVSHSRGTGCPICNQSRIIATRQPDAFTVPLTHYVSNNCVYILSHVFAGTDSIAIDLMTMKDWLFSQHQPPASGHQQSCHFLLLAVVIAGDCAMTLAFHVLRIICHMKNIITIYFRIWT